MQSRRTLILVASLTLLAAVPGVVTAGCGDGIVYDCKYPIVGRLAQDGQHDVCCRIDACPGHCLEDPCPDGGGNDAGADADNFCPGTCVPVPAAFGWDGPGLLWLGPEGTAPTCPDQAPVVAYQAHQGINTPPAACGACSCAASSGGCSPPLSLSTSSKACNGGSGTTTPFDGPLAWDGSCTAKDCISPSPACAHPMSVQSLTATPLAVTEQGCLPSNAVAPDPGPPTWMTEVLACRGPMFFGLDCNDPNKMCVAAATSGFAMCVAHEKDVSCPANYPVKHVVYDGFDDQRFCSACACGAPVGSGCTASLNVFKDGACTMPLLTEALSSSSTTCVDLVPAGVPLGSKTLTALAYQPGSCAVSGGEPSGSVEPTGAATFCCLTN